MTHDLALAEEVDPATLPSLLALPDAKKGRGVCVSTP